MVANGKRRISETKEFDAFFSAALGIDPVLIHSKAGIPDTIKLIRKVVSETLPQTKALAAFLNGQTHYATAKNIWDFIYQHIAYEKDAPGIEQIRTPNRVWADRFKGVDCDCYSTFISSILTNLRIPHTLRIAKYTSGYFQHIYVVVPVSTEFYKNRHKRNTYIVIDDVKDAFNDEHPFTEIQDTDIIDMDLQLLNGLDNVADEERYLGIPDVSVDGLGRVRRTGGRSKKGSATPAAPILVPQSAAPSTPSTAMVQVVGSGTPVAPQLVVKPQGNCNCEVTRNIGMLKDGSKIERTTIPSRHGFEVYRNGKVWCQLERFIVKRGVMRGHNTQGDVFIAKSDKIIKVPGVKITNKTYPLTGIETEGYGSMFAVNGLGEVTYNESGQRFGMFIPGAEGAKLFDNYYGRISGKPTLSGLGELAEILSDDTIQAIEGIIAGFAGLGELEEEMFGIEGLEGLQSDLELVSVEGADENEHDVVFGLDGDNDWQIDVIDGLGRVRNARVRGSSRGGKASASAAPSEPAPQPPATVVANAVPTTKLLGWYIPFNTLKNIIAIRNKQIERLRANGHTVNAGTIPLSLNGLDMSELEGLGDLGKLFKKLGQGIAKGIQKASPLISIGANFIPGGGIAKMGLTNLNKFTGGKVVPSFLKAGAGKSGANILSLLKKKPAMVVSQPLPSQAFSAGGENGGQVSMFQSNPADALREEQEITAAYNKLAQHDLSGTSPSVVDWAKRNPFLAIGSGAVIGYGIYEGIKFFFFKEGKGKPNSKPKTANTGGKSKGGKAKAFKVVGF